MSRFSMRVSGVERVSELMMGISDTVNHLSDQIVYLREACNQLALTVELYPSQGAEQNSLPEGALNPPAESESKD